MDGQRIVMEKDRVHILRTIFLWRDAAYQQLGVRNYGDQSDRSRLAINFESDFADLLRFAARAVTGAVPRLQNLTATTKSFLNYNGLDGRTRRTALHFDPPPDKLYDQFSLYKLNLKPGEICAFHRRELRPDRRAAVAVPARSIARAAKCANRRANERPCKRRISV